MATKLIVQDNLWFTGEPQYANYYRNGRKMVAVTPRQGFTASADARAKRKELRWLFRPMGPHVYRLLALLGIARQVWNEKRTKLVRTTADLVGHSDVRMTQNVYDHASDQRKREAAERTGEQLFGSAARRLVIRGFGGRIR